MKIFVLTKRTLVAAAALMILAGISVPGIMESVETSSSSKELPIYCVQRTDKKIAVTFDSAWNDTDIDSIISVLQEKNCPSTFFVTGKWAESYPEALKKLSSAGHEIASHSYNHSLYSTLSKDEIIADMDKCDNAIKTILSSAPTLVRAPSGDYTNDSIMAAKETGRIPIQWDVDSLDWKGLSEADMKKRISEKIAPGSIILFHNGTEQTAAALPGILDMLIQDGYEFVKVSDLIYKDNYHIDSTGCQIPS